jgi:CheY-like chemotaxis protein
MKGVRLAVWRLPSAPATITYMTTVLIVDDHASFRRMARKLLEAEGFDVVGEASNGAEALVAVAHLRPDLVLLDVQMPDMDGFEVAERLCANGSRPVVVLTSSRDAAEFGGLIERSPVRGFVPKAELSGRRLEALLE